MWWVFLDCIHTEAEDAPVVLKLVLNIWKHLLLEFRQRPSYVLLRMQTTLYGKHNTHTHALDYSSFTLTAGLTKNCTNLTYICQKLLSHFNLHRLNTNTHRQSYKSEFRNAATPVLGLCVCVDETLTASWSRKCEQI